MRKIANKLFIGARLLGQTLLTVLPDLLFLRHHFDDHLIRAQGMGDHHMHQHGVLATAAQRGVITEHRERIFLHALQSAQQWLGFKKVIGQQRARNHAPGKPHGVFKHRVAELHPPLRVDHAD